MKNSTESSPSPELPPHAEDIRRLADMLKAGNVDEAIALCAEMAAVAPCMVDRRDLEDDFIQIQNGLAAVSLIGQALEGIGVDNDELVARGLQFVASNMNDAVIRLGAYANLIDGDGK